MPIAALEGTLAKAVAPSADAKEGETPSESELKAVAKYKDVIREQDAQIQHLQQRLANLEGDHIVAQVTQYYNRNIYFLFFEIF